MKEKKGAVFLDRDGTIIEDRDYLSDPKDIKLIPGSVKAVRSINNMGFKAIVVTNQSGVARGYFQEKNIAEVHEKLKELFNKEGAQIDAFYYCPHHPTAGEGPYRTECQCRKPETGMLDAAVRDFDLDQASSYVIGDKLIDIEMAQRAGARGILVKTGYGIKELEKLKANSETVPDHIAEDLLNAVEWLKKEEEGS